MGRKIARIWWPKASKEAQEPRKGTLQTFDKTYQDTIKSFEIKKTRHGKGKKQNLQKKRFAELKRGNQAR